MHENDRFEKRLVIGVSGKQEVTEPTALCQKERFRRSYHFLSRSLTAHLDVENECFTAFLYCKWENVHSAI